MRQPLFQKLNQLSTERWARRGLRTLVRAAWLCLCIWCAALGAHLLWGLPLRTNLLGALVLAVVGGAVVLLLRPRLSPHSAARRLDRRFHLDEQLATAVEVAATNPPPDSIAARLVMESSHTAEVLQRRIARGHRPPWHDLLTLVALGLVALGLWIMSGIGFPDLAGGTLPLPALATAQDPAQQLPQEQQTPDQQQQGAPGDTSQAAQDGAPGQSSAASQAGAPDARTLQALADALRDQGATRPAAEALDRGDLAGAAQSLRELADQASQLSQEARDDLASKLEDAARQVAGRDQPLAEQLHQSADGLERGGQDAAQALDDLARAIDQLQPASPNQQAQGEQPGQGQQPGQGEQPGDAQSPSADQSSGQGQQPGEAGQGQGQGNSAGGAGNGSGEQRQTGQNNPLNVEGQPVPLESSGAGQVPAESSGKPPTTTSASGNGGFTQGDTSSDQRVQVGEDPLRVPNDERDVVQDYFQPQK